MTSVKKEWPISVVLFTIISSAVGFLKVNVTGDFILGAMYPVHKLGDAGRCGDSITDQAGLQNLEAFLYSLDKVNKELFNDTDFKMGTLSFDNCFSDLVALEEAVQYARMQSNVLDIASMYQCNDSNRPNPVNTGKLIGVVCCFSSGVTMKLADFLSLFEIPLMSYSASSPYLSDTKKYKNFVRTVASDHYQAKAVIDTLRYFKWEYVVALYGETSYGRGIFGEAKKYAESIGICMVEEIEIKRYFENITEEKTVLGSYVDRIRKYNNTFGKTVVLIFTHHDIANALFDVVIEKDLWGKFIWVGSDGWVGYTPTAKNPSIVEGSLGSQFKNKSMVELDEYFVKLTPETNKRNPWFVEYWEQIFNCTYNPEGNMTGNICNKTLRFSEKDVSHCAPKRQMAYCEKYDRKWSNGPFYSVNSTDNPFTGTYKKNVNTYSVYDCVYAFGYAIRDWHRDLCGETRHVCDALMKANAVDLMKYFPNISFTDPAGFEFSFTGNGGPPRYSIMRFEKVDNKGYDWIEVGGVTDVSEELEWYRNLTPLYQESICAKPCKPGEARIKAPDNKCCWTCHPCDEYHYLKPDFSSCLECSLGFRANSEKTGCEVIPETTMEWSNVWVSTTVFISCCGIVLTLITGGLFYRHRETPIIRASGKELSFILLFGILLSFLSTFPLTSYPTAFTCGISRFMIGLSYTICYSSILVKANRIYRVLTSNAIKHRKLLFVTTKSQLIMILGIVCIEIGILLSWLIFDLPNVSFDFPTRAENVRFCDDFGDFAFLVAVIYPFLLVILCLVYAIKARKSKTPYQFLETRFISGCSSAIFVLWIAFGSVYFSVEGNTTKPFTLCISSSVNATAILLTFCITKLYIVIVRPEKNSTNYIIMPIRSGVSDRNIPSKSETTAFKPSSSDSPMSLTALTFPKQPDKCEENLDINGADNAVPFINPDED